MLNIFLFFAEKRSMFVGLVFLVRLKLLANLKNEKKNKKEQTQNTEQGSMNILLMSSSAFINKITTHRSRQQT